jgi:hypothetical protein
VDATDPARAAAGEDRTTTKEAVMRSTLDREVELYHAFPREQRLVHQPPPSRATVAFAEAVVVVAGLLVALVIVAMLMAL